MIRRHQRLRVHIAAYVASLMIPPTHPPVSVPALASGNQIDGGFYKGFFRSLLKPFEFHGYLRNRRIYTFGDRYIFAGQEPRADASILDYLQPLTDIASQISGMPANAFE